MRVKGRFLLIYAEDSPTIKVRVADALRVNLAEDDPARTDDHEFALAILQAISSLDSPDSEGITLNVFEHEEEYL